MESAGNAVIDFGRFCTGFLVVMGVGTFKQSNPPDKTSMTAVGRLHTVDHGS
jgi:hypothetical protein